MMQLKVVVIIIFIIVIIIIIFRCNELLDLHFSQQMSVRKNI